MDLSTFEACYQAYRNAINAQNVNEAKKYATMAIEDAMKEKSNASPKMQEYYQGHINKLQEFLANPVIRSAAVTTSAGTDSEKKIKSTDWFAAPIPDLNLGAIAGLQDVKDAFLVNIYAPMSEDFADIYKKYRGEERGLQVLLYGPPGTGKTHAVKCLAGEMKCKIAVVQVKDVMANLVGDGAKIIAEIFEQAKNLDKCIIFFDEIDAIASSRESDD